MSARPRMRVLAVVPYPLGRAPGQRYRIEQWAPYLREDGIELHFESFAGEVLAETLYQPGPLPQQGGLDDPRVARHDRARVAGVGFRCRLLVSGSLARGAGPAGEARSPGATQESSTTSTTLSGSATRARTTATSPISKRRERRAHSVAWRPQWSWATSTSRNMLGATIHHVTIIPSTVSLRQYRPAPHGQKPSERVIGWTGSHSSIQYLRMVEGALQRLARRRRFRLRVVGVEGYSISGVDVECRPWVASTEVEDLWPIAVGIMPLTEDPWTLGKCAMKAIQYLGIGVPAVGEPSRSERGRSRPRSDRLSCTNRGRLDTCARALSRRRRSSGSNGERQAVTSSKRVTQPRLKRRASRRL